MWSFMFMLKVLLYCIIKHGLYDYVRAIFPNPSTHYPNHPSSVFPHHRSFERAVEFLAVFVAPHLPDASYAKHCRLPPHWDRFHKNENSLPLWKPLPHHGPVRVSGSHRFAPSRACNRSCERIPSPSPAAFPIGTSLVLP